MTILSVDDLRLGLAFRRIRVRRGWRQQDVAVRARISRSSYSRIERGHLETVDVGRLRSVARVLEIGLDIVPRWRGAELDRLMAAGHSRMHERVAGMLSSAGWELRPEVSFNHFGERGVVDILAWRERERALLIVELKTQIVDVNDLLTTMNRRRRLVPVIVDPLGWTPASVSSWVVVADSRTNRRRLAAHRTMLRSAFPTDGRAIRGWLAAPVRPVASLWFLPDDRDTNVRPTPTRVRRVSAATPLMGSRRAS